MGTFPQYDHPRTLERYAENLIKAIDELKEKVGIRKTIKDYTKWWNRLLTTSAQVQIQDTRL